jgi:hypothetical protein
MTFLIQGFLPKASKQFAHGFIDLEMKMRNRADVKQMANCFVKETDYVTREIAGETIIVPTRSHVADLDAIFTLNEIGTLIWNLVDGQNSLNQIVAAVTDEYEIASEQAEKDVVGFLNSLETAGLIRPCQ